MSIDTSSYPDSVAIKGPVTFQSEVGEPLNYSYLYERIRRVKKTTANASPVQFSGIASNTDNTLQSGHGWTATGNTNGNLNYTTDFLMGTQCIQVSTDGGGTTAAVVTSPRMTAVNLTGKMVRIWLKFDANLMNTINHLWFFVGSGASAFLNNTNTQLLASGANALTEYAKVGEWVCYTFNPASFVNGLTGTMDWTAIQDFRINLKDNGTGAAIVYFGGIDFIPNDSAYSTGVVSITFDDAYASQYTFARYRLEQYGYKATFYPIQDLLGQGGYMTKAQLDQLQALNHEIACHAWLNADHTASAGATDGFCSLSTQALLSDVGRFKGWCHYNGYRGNEHVATPQGKYNASVLLTIKRQFAAHRTTTFRSIETLPVADPYSLRAITHCATSGPAVSPNSTLGTIEWYLDQIASYGGWLILYYHDFAVSSPSGVQTLQADYNTVIDYIAAKSLPVRTIGDVLEI